jgi:hypothetical protein
MIAQKGHPYEHPEDIAECDESGKEAVERSETTKPVGVTCWLRRVDGLEARRFSNIFVPSSLMNEDGLEELASVGRAE